ncbi:hypothetical protein DYB38_002100 [Aphanomyces astaci]|uniref:Coiled-coil domain-containing protein 61 n=1 Tax=Aphanomyces astaci TaxID=112090 RepID=A0A397C2A6_APHAT|nr:hypothetical protein DYB38_002100 [Aphanomyces astaci]
MDDIDIEELTKKTGNFKRFYTFVNMLMSALQHKSESVFIDLLTYSDLELYRKRKLGKSAPSTNLPDPVAALNNKRYLILTYAVEFDRVHYPLPLNFVENPSPAMLQRTIRRLKQTLLETRTSSIDGPANKTLASMQAENASLRLRIQQLQDTREDNQDDLSSSVVHLKRQLQLTRLERLEAASDRRDPRIERDLDDCAGIAAEKSRIASSAGHPKDQIESSTQVKSTHRSAQRRS